MKWLEGFKNRKFVLFLVALAVIAILSFFNKETMSVVALYSAYAATNAASKFAYHKEELAVQ